MREAWDLQSEAEIDWWRDAHDLAEARRLQLEQTAAKALAELDGALQEEVWEDAWGRYQKARTLLRKELGK